MLQSLYGYRQKLKSMSEIEQEDVGSCCYEERVGTGGIWEWAALCATVRASGNWFGGVLCYR